MNTVGRRQKPPWYSFTATIYEDRGIGWVWWAGRDYGIGWGWDWRSDDIPRADKESSVLVTARWCSGSVDILDAAVREDAATTFWVDWPIRHGSVEDHASLQCIDPEPSRASCNALTELSTEWGGVYSAAEADVLIQSLAIGAATAGQGYKGKWKGRENGTRQSVWF